MTGFRYERDGWVLSIGQSGAAEIQLGKCPIVRGRRINPVSMQIAENCCGRAQKSFHAHANAACDVAATPPPPLPCGSISYQ